MPPCNHTLNHTKGSWTTVTYNNRKRVQCVACGRFYGYVMEQPKQEARSFLPEPTQSPTPSDLFAQEEE